MTQTQLLEKEIYLIDQIQNRKRERMNHLKCIIFTRPTPSSFQHIQMELREPCFGDYYLCNIIINIRFFQRCTEK